MGATSFPSSTSIACVYWEIWQIWSWKPTVPGRKKTQVVMAGVASGSQEGPPAEGLRVGGGGSATAVVRDIKAVRGPRVPAPSPAVLHSI